MQQLFYLCNTDCILRHEFDGFTAEQKCHGVSKERVRGLAPYLPDVGTKPAAINHTPRQKKREIVPPPGTITIIDHMPMPSKREAENIERDTLSGSLGFYGATGAPCSDAMATSDTESSESDFPTVWHCGVSGIWCRDALSTSTGDHSKRDHPSG